MGFGISCSLSIHSCWTIITSGPFALPSCLLPLFSLSQETQVTSRINTILNYPKLIKYISCDPRLKKKNLPNCCAHFMKKQLCFLGVNTVLRACLYVLFHGLNVCEDLV